jgi:cytidine deaminase
VSAARRNVEIKAVDPDPARTLERAVVAEVVVVSPARELCAPCGGCRQRLREFMPADAPVHLADLERVRHTTTLGALLPLSFGPESLA